jgi:hypothetical protein
LREIIQIWRINRVRERGERERFSGQIEGVIVKISFQQESRRRGDRKTLAVFISSS